MILTAPTQRVDTMARAEAPRGTEPTEDQIGEGFAELLSECAPPELPESPALHAEPDMVRVEEGSGDTMAGAGQGEDAAGQLGDEVAQAPALVSGARASAAPIVPPFWTTTRQLEPASPPVPLEDTSSAPRVKSATSFDAPVAQDLETSTRFNAALTIVPTEREGTRALPPIAETRVPVAHLPATLSRVVAGEGGHAIVLRLDPPELGDVTVRLSVRGNQVDVQVACAAASVPTVRAHLAGLASSLGGAGLVLRALQVADEDEPTRREERVKQPKGRARSQRSVRTII